MRERWKDIPETDGRYSVSNTGKVKHNSDGYILTPRYTHTGYQRVGYKMSGNKTVDRYIHRLVAEAFCKHKKGNDVVNHIDNNPSNNIYTNLEWTTQADNVRYAMSQDRMPGFPNARKVIGSKNGKETIYVSANEAARKIGCCPTGIFQCCNHKYNRQTCFGYTWRWAEE